MTTDSLIQALKTARRDARPADNTAHGLDLAIRMAEELANDTDAACKPAPGADSGFPASDAVECRAAFEAYFRKINKSGSLSWVWKDEKYADYATQGMWIGWQACWNARPALSEAMVERVAKAICPWDNGLKIAVNPDFMFANMHERFKAAYREQARAAIATMQEGK